MVICYTAQKMNTKREPEPKMSGPVRLAPLPNGGALVATASAPLLHGCLARLCGTAQTGGGCGGSESRRVPLSSVRVWVQCDARIRALVPRRHFLSAPTPGDRPQAGLSVKITDKARPAAESECGSPVPSFLPTLVPGGLLYPWWHCPSPHSDTPAPHQANLTRI